MGCVEIGGARVHQFMHNFVKGSIMFILAMAGLIFALVGLGTYITYKVPDLGNGVGFILLGVVMLLLVGFAKMMQKE